MWIFTSHSFLSIVADRNNPSRRLVRARCKGDIETVFPDAAVFEDLDADYRYRAYLDASEVEAQIGHLIRRMNYHNFKHSIPDKKPEYQSACLAVWATMKQLQK